MTSVTARLISCQQSVAAPLTDPSSQRRTLRTENQLNKRRHSLPPSLPPSLSLSPSQSSPTFSGDLSLTTQAKDGCYARKINQLNKRSLSLSLSLSLVRSLALSPPSLPPPHPLSSLSLPNLVCRVKQHQHTMMMIDRLHQSILTI